MSIEETIYKILIGAMVLLVLYQFIVVVNSVNVNVKSSTINQDSTYTISFMYKGKAYALISDVNFNIEQEIRVNKKLFEDSFYIQSKTVKTILFCLFVFILLGILFLYIRLYGEEEIYLYNSREKTPSPQRSSPQRSSPFRQYPYVESSSIPLRQEDLY